MRRTATLYGLLGLVLLAFGLVDMVLAGGTFRFFVWLNLVGGVMMIVLWIMSSRSALASIAGSRSTRYGANAAIYTVTFILILVAVNYISSLHHARIDLTSERVYSLSSQSVNVVKALKKPIRFYGFFRGGENPEARRIYEMYGYASPLVSFELIDPEQHPEMAEKFNITKLNTTHIQYGGEKGTGSNVTELNEEDLTNAILRLTKATKKVVDFLDGHGEADPDSTEDANGYGQLRKDLEGEGYEVRKLVLASLPKVPDEVNIVVVAGPVKPLLPHEIEQLTEYLKRGGRMMMSFRPQHPDEPIDETALIKLASDWGVQVQNDVVVDQVVRLFAGPALGLNPIVQTFGEHPITHNFTQKVVFPMSRSLTPEPNLKPGLTVVDLAKTSDTSWGETDLDGIFKRQEAKLDAKDLRGPVSVTDAVEADLDKLAMGKGTARIVVFGSTDFVNNQYLTTFFARDFFINCADWLAGEETQISIRPRSLRASRFRLTVDQFAVVFALSVLLLPELLLIIGIAVWWERRN